MVARSSSLTVFRTTPWMPLIPAIRILRKEKKELLKRRNTAPPSLAVCLCKIHKMESKGYFYQLKPDAEKEQKELPLLS